MSDETPTHCSFCNRQLATLRMPAGYPFHVKVNGKRYVGCSPRCAFDLGAMLAPYGRYTPSAK